MMRWRSFLVLAVLVFLQGCRKDENLIAFCQLGTNPDQAGRVYFDLANKIAFAADTKSSLEPIQTGQFVGFTHPFPIMAPSRDTLLKGQPVSWTMDGYEFSSIPQGPREAKWFLITATKTKESQAADASITVLYSVDSGVIAYKRVTEFEGRKFESEYHICSKRKFLLTDLPGTAL